MGTAVTNTGQHNTGIGANVFYALNGGGDNVAIGYDGLGSLQAGGSNVAIGSNALRGVVGGDNNVGIGYAAGKSITGSNNITIGHQAGNDWSIGSGNSAGVAITSGSDNIIIGKDADASIAAASNQIVIGTNATGHGDNKVVIGNGSTLNWEPHDDDEVDLGSSSYRFDDVYASNGTIQTSDLRLKKQIKKSDLGLAFIKELNPVSYYWKKNDNGRHYGLIAQELLGVFQKHGIKNVDEIATLDWDAENDRYGLRYTELISPMIKSIQEQQQMIESQNNTIAELKENLKRLENLILDNK
tara:strand:- start:962 stop:1858 length:897 start_codon:yes stop_codon:yes gene_type:complete